MMTDDMVQEVDIISEDVEESKKEDVLEEALDVKKLTQVVNRYFRAAEILKETKANVVAYKDSGNFGVKVTISGIREKVICEMVAKELTTRIENLSKTVLLQVSQLLSEMSSGVKEQVY